MLLLFILAGAIGFALTIMACWHLWLISKGETSVESSDNHYYRKISKGRGLQFYNPFDLGARTNLELFFNVGASRFPYYTVLLPMSVPPSSDGWVWQKREGWENASIAVADELTDEETD